MHCISENIEKKKQRPGKENEMSRQPVKDNLKDFG